MDSWDKVAGWILLLALVFGCTQVLLAQHSQDEHAVIASPRESQTTPQHDETTATAEQRKHWSAEPGCFAQTGDIQDRTTSRSWTLASPDGMYRAYAVNEATAERASNELSGCKSTSALFVSRAGRDQVQALVVNPVKGESGNSIELVDWSREGHRLVVIVGYWAWASDTGGILARVYDADSGKLTGESLLHDEFSRLLGRRCSGTFDPLGFSEDGKVVVRAYPDLDEEQTLQEQSCVKKVEIWEIDPVTAKLSRLPDDYKVGRYGKRVVDPNDSSRESSRR